MKSRLLFKLPDLLLQ